MKFEGIYTPAITPHAPDGAINREAFAEVLESLIAAGVRGIIVGVRRANITRTPRRSGSTSRRVPGR